MFTINNIAWNVVFVPPHSEYLKNSLGAYTLGVTDNNLKTVFLNNRLKGGMFEKVLCHEIVHTFCFFLWLIYLIFKQRKL